MTKRFALSLAMLCLLAGGCATVQPTNVDNVCEIFREYPSWFDAAEQAEDNWGTPVHVSMAIIRRESTFVGNARPPRKKLFGFIPWLRPSSAFGYAQVKDDTWAWYQDKAGNSWGQRSDFDDAIDFVAWYVHINQRTNGVSKWDAEKQYLAYHEGLTGYKRGSYRSKAWLMKVARQVDQTAGRYASQLATCREELERSWLEKLLPFL